METPYTNHLSREDYEFVYEPAEDTFLLLDALEADLTFIQSLHPALCVEIGSGSGVIITAISKKLKSSYSLAVDINYKSCLATKRTALHNAANVDVLRMDLTSFLRAREIDLLVFNPPYVLTEEDENILANNITHQELAYSWNGGFDGRKVIDKLLKNLKNIISPSGIVYLLVLKENNPDDIIQYLKSSAFKATIFMQRKIPGEHLYVLKIVNENFE